MPLCLGYATHSPGKLREHSGHVLGDVQESSESFPPVSRKYEGNVLESTGKRPGKPLTVLATISQSSVSRTFCRGIRQLEPHDPHVIIFASGRMLVSAPKDHGKSCRKGGTI